jgi:excisionase family DNA binding protein
MVKTKAKTDENLLTVQEAATERAVSRARIYQWINEGRLTKHEKYGRTLVSRIELSEIEARQGGWPKGKSRKGE